MIKVSKMNATQRIAYRNIRGIFMWETGGWYNCILDGFAECIPDTMDEAKELIYREALVDSAVPGHYACGRAPREMRFAGADFLHECVDYLFARDPEGDVAEIAEVKGWR